MKSRIKLVIQIISLLGFAFIVIWGGPSAWQQVALGDFKFMLIAFFALGVATMISALRLQLISRSISGQTLAPLTRFYSLNMFVRVIGLVIPRSLSTIGGKSIALSNIGIPIRNAVWFVLIDNAFDLALLGVLIGPALYHLRKPDATWAYVAMSIFVILVLAGVIWSMISSGKIRSVIIRMIKIPWIASSLHLEVNGLDDILLSRTEALRALSLSVVLNGLLALSFYYIAQAIGLNYSWLLFLACFPITQLSMILAVTPGGIGLYDAGWYSVLLLAGIPNQQALPFVIAQRAFIFLYVIMWAGFAFLLSFITDSSKRVTN